MNENKRINRYKIIKYTGALFLTVGVLISIKDIKEEANSKENNSPNSFSDYYDDNLNNEQNDSEYYYLKPEYYGYKTITKISHGNTKEETIKIAATEIVDEEGNISYVVPDGYELGVKYKLVKYEDETINLDEEKINIENRG